MSDLFLRLMRRASAKVQEDYEEARHHVVGKDIQRGGHTGEATWDKLIQDWGPGLPIVTRKYVVGPDSETNEIDVLVLKHDYPVSLHAEASILASGVAAAFSVKTTLRKGHILEAIEQKRDLSKAAGSSSGDVEKVLRGPIPFGILSHTSQWKSSDALLDAYEAEAYKGPGRVSHPAEELDSVLAADMAFLRMNRMTLDLTNRFPDPGPTSMMVVGSMQEDLQGAHLAQFFTWLGSILSQSDQSALALLENVFGVSGTQGYQAHEQKWPMDVYPKHLQTKAQLAPNGGPILF